MYKGIVIRNGGDGWSAKDIEIDREFTVDENGNADTQINAIFTNSGPIDHAIVRIINAGNIDRIPLHKLSLAVPSVP